MIDKLVTISGFVEGRLVRFDDSQEVLFSARQLAESPVDLEWDVFDDGRRMVGEAADVQRGGVGLHVGLVSASGEVQSDVEEVDDLLVHLGSHLEPVVLIHLLYLLPELLSEAVGQGAHCQAIIPVEAEVNREVLKLVEEEESDEISSLSSIEAAHRHVELLSLLLDPGAVVVEEDGLLAGKDDVFVLLRGGDHCAGPLHWFM